MIFGSLLTACGQTISASETVIDGETASVISEIVSEKEVLPNGDKDAETVTAGLPSIGSLIRTGRKLILTIWTILFGLTARK